MFTLSLLRDNQQGACCGFRPRSMSEFIYGVRVISATLPRSFRISTMRQYSVTVCHLQGVLPVWLCSGQDLERDAILITFAVPLHPKHDCSLDKKLSKFSNLRGVFPQEQTLKPRKLEVCANGASLTEKCRNIPALVNQLPSELGPLVQSFTVGSCRP